MLFTEQVEVPVSDEEEALAYCSEDKDLEHLMEALHILFDFMDIKLVVKLEVLVFKKLKSKESKFPSAIFVSPFLQPFTLDTSIAELASDTNLPFILESSLLT